MSTAFLFNNKMMKYGTHAMGISSSPTPPVPVIPANTVRVRTNDGNPPVKSYEATFESATLVEGTTDVYDVYKSGTSFDGLLIRCTNITEVLGANLTGITSSYYMFQGCSSLTTVNNILNTSAIENTAFMFSYCSSLTSAPLFNTSSVTTMSNMFSGCSSLTTVPLLDTSSVTNMTRMFQDCSSLTTIPLLDTRSVTNMQYMFRSCTSLTTVPLLNTSNVTSMLHMFNGCINVESGALALYQQASTQANPPSNHTSTFKDCGSNTVTGAAELAQIPSSWGGTGA